MNQNKTNINQIDDTSNISTIEMNQLLYKSTSYIQSSTEV